MKYKAIVTKESSAKIVNFITIEEWGLMLGRGYMNHYSIHLFHENMSPSDKKSVYSLWYSGDR